MSERRQQRCNFKDDEYNVSTSGGVWCLARAVKQQRTAWFIGCRSAKRTIFELKTDSAKKAIKQIIEKNYAGAYGNYQVTLVGLQIDFTERNIVKYQTEVL